MTSLLSSFAYCKNLNISITKEYISKRKTPFVFISKSLKISRNYFLLHMHFKVSDALSGAECTIVIVVWAAVC